MATAENAAAPGTLTGLDWLNFFLADVQTGVGPFLAIYLMKNGWNEETVGAALTVGGIAGILAQTPAGALVDRLHSKRALIIGGIACLIAGSLVIAFFPAVGQVMTAQVVIGAGSTVFIPAIAAISLGVVGHRSFDRRQGRNQAFNSAGNVTAAIAMGLIAYFISDRAIFFLMAAITVPTLGALGLISPRDIDYDLARGGEENTSKGASTLADLTRDRDLVLFLVCAVLFHFANAAMLPLLGEMLSKGGGRASMMFMSACIVTTQLVITFIAISVGKAAGSWGRKPLMLIAFSVLPIRGILYVLTANTALLVSIQVLDGIGAGIFGVVSVLVIADLTRGTGRFNLALGAVTAAVGTGAALSQVIAGGLVHHFGYKTGFLFLSAIAGLALALLAFKMPETSRRTAMAASASI